MKIIMYIIGLVLIALYFIGRYNRKKRQYESRFLGKGPNYQSYNAALKGGIRENFIRFLGVLAFVVGLILLFFAFFVYDDFIAHL